MDREKAIFKQASTTYYWSSKFFPARVREDIWRLYCFVRLADDYASSLPAHKAAFRSFREAWDKAAQDESFNTAPSLRDSAATRAIKNMVYLSRKYAFDPEWTKAFLDARQADLEQQAYRTIDDTLQYIHGSAEVIGLMMSRIMGLPPAAADAARLQGRAMQFINLIRDIAEDNTLGRQYLPAEDLERFGLSDIRLETVLANQAAFTKLIRFELSRYRKWQAEATAAYHHLSRRLLVPVKTAADMYGWTARQIERDPLVVFVRKVKPTKPRVVRRAFTNIVVR